jgi:hypothetical protein
MTKEQCLTCGEWFEDSDMDAHLSEHLKEPESEEQVGPESEQVEQLPLKSPLRQGAEFDRQSGLSHSTKYSPEETLSKADMYLRASGYTVRVQGSTLQAVHGRGRKGPTWSFIGLVLLLVFSIYEVLVLSNFWYLFFLPLGIIYWFRKKNQIEITVAGGQFVIEYHGGRAVGDAKLLSSMLRE